MCDHMRYSQTNHKESVRSDGAIVYFSTNECTNCGEKWKELHVKKTNISTAEYIQHLGMNHSENSPSIRVVKEGETRSGEQYPDTYVDYEDCHTCIKWSKQKHQW